MTASVTVKFALLVTIGSAMMASQTPDRPTFDVAAITANHDGGKKGTIRSLPGGRFTATNVTLRDLLDAAHPLQSSSALVGAPSWVTVDRFDVIAKAPGNVDDRIRTSAKGNGAKEKVSAPQSGDVSTEQLMLRALLEERFKLAVHEETRDQSVYLLRLARANGSPGPKLTRSSVDCATAGGSKSDKACGVKILPGEVIGHGTTMGQLAASVSQVVHRTVVDRTGLTGAFDMTLTWTPDQPASHGGKATSKRTIDPNGPSLFTAIQEQLGLKLESGRGPATVLVIDHVEHPSVD